MATLTALAQVEESRGSQTATIDQEHTLVDFTLPAVYTMVIDTANMQAGDSVTFRIKTKCRSGDALRLAYEMVYSHAQVEINKYLPSVPVASNAQYQVTLEQTDGTGRAFPWRLFVGA